MKVKLLKPHRKDCFALANAEDGTWNTPWFYDSWYPATHENRDAAGRRTRRGYRRWVHLRCNDTDCKADLVVDLDLLEAEAWEQEKRGGEA